MIIIDGKIYSVKYWKRNKEWEKKHRSTDAVYEIIFTVVKNKLLPYNHITLQYYYDFKNGTINWYPLTQEQFENDLLKYIF